MSLSDCPRCWDTPCTCGYEYRNYTEDEAVKFVLECLIYKGKEKGKEIIQRALTEADNYPYWKDLKQEEI